ncbi:WD40-repeat-containing domain protein [Sporodiniella umbellata]|nr:WD40-repeat-containing domain protein [Sporodiniella umbellata]
MASMTQLSAYEKKRLENIKENEAIMKSLAIPNLETKRKRPVLEPAKKKSQRVAQQPTRISSRLRGKEPETTVQETAHEPVQKPETLDRLEAIDHQAILDLFQPAPSQKTPAWETVLEDLEIRHRWSTVKVTPSRIYSALFHPSSTKLIGCAVDVEGYLGFWDIHDSGEQPRVYQYRPHTRTITDFKMDPNNDQKLWTASYDGHIRQFDCQSATFTTLKLQGDYSLTSLGLDGSTVWFSTSDGELGQVDPRTGQAPTVVSIRDKKVGCIDVHPVRGELIAAGCNDRTASVWDVRGKWKEALATVEHGYAVTSCYWSPQGSQLATSCYDDQIRVMDLSPQHDLTIRHHIAHNHHTGRWVTNFRARWHPSQPALVIGNMKQTVDIYSSTTGQALHRLYDPDHVTAIPSVVQCHPSQPALLTGNASGRMLCWQS